MPEHTSSVDMAYERVRDMAIDFVFKPGERLNETTLTTKLHVSRTPLREALNRLVAEGFLTSAKGQGFFCRSLRPEQVTELYQVRCALETEAVRRGVENASDRDIEAFCSYLDAIEDTYETCTDPTELVRMDEDYHLRMVALSGNGELLRMLKNVNERIRYVRLINLHELQKKRSQGAAQSDDDMPAHRVVAEAIRTRDAETAITALRRHIERRSEEVVELVQLAYSRLYVPTP